MYNQVVAPKCKFDVHLKIKCHSWDIKLLFKSRNLLQDVLSPIYYTFWNIEQFNKLMDVDPIVIPKFQIFKNNRLFVVACWADNVGMAQDIILYVHVRHARIAKAQTSLLLKLWNGNNT